MLYSINNDNHNQAQFYLDSYTDIQLCIEPNIQQSSCGMLQLSTTIDKLTRQSVTIVCETVDRLALPSLPSITSLLSTLTSGVNIVYFAKSTMQQNALFKLTGSITQIEQQNINHNQYVCNVCGILLHPAQIDLKTRHNISIQCLQCNTVNMSTQLSYSLTVSIKLLDFIGNIQCIFNSNILNYLMRNISPNDRQQYMARNNLNRIRPLLIDKNVSLICTIYNPTNDDAVSHRLVCQAVDIISA